jgi:hypothetical protein
VDVIPWLSVRYCARQDATGLLELWALTLVLAGAAVAILLAARLKSGRPNHQSATRLLAGGILFFALLTGALALFIIYGCSMTAAGSQGLLSDLPARTLTMLQCLNGDVLATVGAWVLLVGSAIAALQLLVLGIVRRNVAIRAAAAPRKA